MRIFPLCWSWHNAISLRFLEKLANCNVTVSDEQGGWSFDVPAFSKFAVRDLKAHCTQTGPKRVHVTVYPSGEEPTLEFSSSELKAACKSGYLVPPVVTLFVPAAETQLGYKHFSIASKDQVQKQVSEFLGSDHETRHLAEEVARHVSHQVEVKGRGKTILSITIIPPKVRIALPCPALLSDQRLSQGMDFAAVATKSMSSSVGGGSRRSQVSTEMSRRSRH